MTAKINLARCVFPDSYSYRQMAETLPSLLSMDCSTDMDEFCEALDTHVYFRVDDAILNEHLPTEPRVDR